MGPTNKASESTVKTKSASLYAYHTSISKHDYESKN